MKFGYKKNRSGKVERPSYGWSTRRKGNNRKTHRTQQEKEIQPLKNTKRTKGDK